MTVHPIGVNTWVWVSPLTDDALTRLVPRISDWGFDVVELPIMSTSDWDPAYAADLLAAHGLGATICAGLLPDHDLLTDDAEVLGRTGDFVRGCVRAAATVGAAVVAGPLYSPAGRRWPLSADGRRDALARLVARLRPLAGYAAEHGVTLGLEPLNRFDSSLLNTVEQTLEVVDGVDGLGIALDTFHVNIEERDVAAAFRAAGDRLVHVQVCANDRGTPGADHFDWPAILGALQDVGYAGPLCIESFTAAGLEVPMSVWRPLAASRDAVAVDGLSFLRALMTKDTSTAAVP
ncbi:sugar phosphate isomerase/epimerase family protein [Polymorphospora sp. NPDC050346]|uniref:sugar phosphate isomerase/epimerase family protein n=1 Tax=Polymorphospora sp. NPDC050346 TaxID=3155780 RepID=UPI0033C9437A